MMQFDNRFQFGGVHSSALACASAAAVARRWLSGSCLAVATCLAPWAAAPCAAQTPAPAQHLRIVGGLGALNQYTRHEEPFWTRDLARLSGGRATAEIVPFDRAGIRGQEMLRLVQLGPRLCAPRYDDAICRAQCRRGSRRAKCP